MNADHERAQSLLMEAPIEGITSLDQAWLTVHLGECAECNEFAGTLGLAGQALCAIPVRASDELVAATKARVRIRALELRERAARTALISVSAFIGTVVSSASLYYAWPLVRWIETRFEVPALIVEPGFILAWFLPMVFGAAMLAAARTHAGRPQAAMASQEGMKGESYVE